MNCRPYEAAIVDLARGATPGGDVIDVNSVRAHVASCGECRRRFEVERRLTADLRALASLTANAGASEAVEQALVLAHSSQTVGKAGHAWRAWLGAAAALTLVATGLAAWRPWTSAPPVAPTSPPAPVAAVRPDAVPVLPDRPPAPLPDRRQTKRPPKKATPAAQPGPFVELPASAGLPAFESGAIVRVELSPASLPSYGLQIPPNTAGNPVKADVLVGQDGQARAIRFVSSATEPRSRQ